MRNRYGKAEFGIVVSSLTFEILQAIVRIYDETVGGHGSRYIHPGCVFEMQKMLNNFHSVERRFGSQLDMHSKLWITPAFQSFNGEQVVYFSFDHNFYRPSKAQEIAAEKLETAFYKSIHAFLQEQGIAIELMP